MLRIATIKWVICTGILQFISIFHYASGPHYHFLAWRFVNTHIRAISPGEDAKALVIEKNIWIPIIYFEFLVLCTFSLHIFYLVKMDEKLVPHETYHNQAISNIILSTLCEMSASLIAMYFTDSVYIKCSDYKHLVRFVTLSWISLIHVVPIEYLKDVVRNVYRNVTKIVAKL